MAADARARGWGDPGPPGSAQGRRFARENIVRILAGGITLWVHHQAAPLFQGFLNEIVARGYPLKARADDWGYAHRYIRGLEYLRVLSNHSWGIAVDINALTNPMTSDGRVHTDIPRWVVDVAHKWGLSWGGDYTGRRKDPMHFEVLSTPADVARLIGQLHVLHHAGIKEEPELMVLTAVHPEAGFALCHPDGSVFNHGDGRSKLKRGSRTERVSTRYLGGMNLPKMKKARAKMPGVPIVGFYYLPHKDRGGDYPYVIVYSDGAYYTFPSDGSVAKAA